MREVDAEYCTAKIAILSCYRRYPVNLVAFTGARSLQQDKTDLLSEAQQILGQAADSVEAGIQSLVEGLFGPENSFFTQIPSDIQNLCMYY